MIEYEMAYNDKASTFLNEVQSFSKVGYVVSSIQPTVVPSEGSYRYVLLMERSTKSRGEI